MRPPRIVSRPLRRGVLAAAICAAALIAPLAAASAQPDDPPGPAQPATTSQAAGPVAARSPRPDGSSGPQVRITLDRSLTRVPLDGRVYLLVARAADLNGDLPRDHIDVTEGIPLWGKDVEGWRPGSVRAFRTGAQDPAGVYGYPLAGLHDLPEGEYVVQAFFNRYEGVKRGDGSVVKVHFPCGDGGDLWHSPGNFLSAPKTIRIDRYRSSIELRLDQVITPSEPVPAGGTCQQGNPAASKHVKHLKIRSAKLSAYWGRDIFIAADILLPAGYDDPANAGVRYPMQLIHGHYPRQNPHRFTETGTDAFSVWWRSGTGPRFIAVQLRTENPFYDDSYVVNSANLGPYGDAVNFELLPAIDAAYRTVGRPWARVLTGGSTGGWVALANQLFYPRLYGGVWAGYPDSVDFAAHQLINVYDDPNAYVVEYPWTRVERPAARKTNGEVRWTTRQENSFELALGTKGRSMGQWDIWNAVYGPQGADGYPAQPWNKITGVIDRDVTAKWKPMDLTEQLVARWTTLAPLVNGNVTVFVGDADDYFLNGAVHRMEQRVSALTNPAPRFSFVYGAGKGHGWSPWTPRRLLEVMADHIATHAPVGTDVSGWKPAAVPRTP